MACAYCLGDTCSDLFCGNGNEGLYHDLEVKIVNDKQQFRETIIDLMGNNFVMPLQQEDFNNQTNLKNSILLLWE